MLEQLSSLKTCLNKKYAELKGINNWQFSDSTQIESEDAIWILQDENFNKATNAETATGAAIFDPEIGICLYVQIFNRSCILENQISRALQIRSKLMPTRQHVNSSIDEYGSWRVILHWLVEQNDLAEWIKQAADLREKTAYFEEIPIDAIVGDAGQWPKACNYHGVPRLLFETRKIIRKSDYHTVQKWQSADTVVEEVLKDLKDDFTDPFEIQCATEIELKLNENNVQPSVINRIVNKRQLLRLNVENFRNLKDVSINFRSSEKNVSSTIIHGPNGSGKSSLFEAISFGISGTSERYVKFLEDKSKDIIPDRRGYEAAYLTNLQASNDHTAAHQVKVSLNSNNNENIRLVAPEDAKQKLRSISNNLLSQETSSSLLYRSASDLGADIASSLSAKADKITDLINNALSQATQKQKDFNNRWGLRGNITVRETVVAQFSSKVLNSETPSFSDITTWLRSPVFKEFSIANSALDTLNVWERVERKLIESPKVISKARTQIEIATIIKSYLKELKNAFEKTDDFLSTLSQNSSSFSDEWVNKIGSMSQWLVKESVEKKPLDTENIRKLKEAEQIALKDLELKSRSGSSISARIKYLEESSVFLDQWAKENPQICPTCDTNVEDRAGILPIVVSIRSELNSRLLELRFQYKEIKSKLDGISKDLIAEGVESPPLSSAERSAMIEALSWLLPEGQTVENYLLDTKNVSSITSLIALLKFSPTSRKMDVDQDELSISIAKKIDEILDEYDHVSKLPAAWKTIQKEVSARLHKATDQHLPRTIQALWLEISKNMLPAPWQYVAQPKIHNAVRRSIPEAAIVIANQDTVSLANYILNGAEIHNLGLAWFFTKYLTKGRFVLSSLILDDPDQSMDQPTYRDLCRFLETLVRLHKKHDCELSLVLLLHHDQRALDIARATDGTLHLLRWNKSTPALLHEMNMYGTNVTTLQPDLSVHN